MTNDTTGDAMVATVRDFVSREVIPVVPELEHADEYPAELIAQMGKLGLFGALVPEEFGGFALPAVTYARMIEELSYGWMTLAGVINTHTLGCHMITRFGTQRQKERWLPRMATGELRGAFSLSESDSGSDLRNLRCRATPDGNEYVLDGSKMWVTSGERANILALAARAPEGVTCFMIEKEPGPSFEGITVGPHISKLGYRGVETVEMTYAEHRVHEDAVLGGRDELGRGLASFLSALVLGRINVASRGVGMGRAALDAAVKYSHERHTFGVPINKHQAIRFKLADMATKLAAARALVAVAANAFDSGQRSDLEASMAKLFATESCLEIVTEAMRIHGGYGYTTDFPIERYYRDAPLMVIGEGTNEIQRVVIARRLLEQHGLGSHE